MKLAIASLLLAAACEHAEPLPDAMPDASTESTFHVPVGAACNNPNSLCADGVGICFDGTCRAQCEPDAHPGMPCESGATPHPYEADGYQRCACVPQ
ncbi:MAG TPA: hypothetical protein VFS06_03535 [Casimicrobiaceae bacterium]|nr:hypothetical protein [Casimicrobiaceae bacterium]